MTFEEQKQQYLRSKTHEQRYKAILELLDLADCRFLLEKLQTTDFFTAPASASFHLNEFGGLVQHILHVYQGMGGTIGEQTKAKLALIHDFCKINLYEPNLLKSGNVSTAKPWKVSKTAVPLGHGEYSIIRALQWGVPLTEEEMVAIRWHMGNDDYYYQYKSLRNSIEKKYYTIVKALQRADQDAAHEEVENQ